MKTLILLAFLLAVAPAWADCVTVSVLSTASTAVFPAQAGTTLRYLDIQNVSEATGGCDVYCALGGAAALHAGHLLAQHGGEWAPLGPLPANSIACIANACTAPIYACEW